MLLQILSMAISFISKSMNQDEENYEDFIMFKGKKYYEIPAQIFPINLSNPKMNLSSKNINTEDMPNYFLFNWTNPGYFKVFSEIKCKANLNFNLMMIGTFVFILISIISTFLREGKHFKILIFLVSLFSFLFSYFSSILEKYSSVLISCGYFYSSMYLVNYLIELFLEEWDPKICNEQNECDSTCTNPPITKNRILLQILFIIFCFWMSLYRTNALYSVPFILSFLNFINEISQLIKSTKIICIQPISNLINIIIGLIWICGLNYQIEILKIGLIYPLIGVLLIQYYLHNFAFCKYYNLENLYLTDYSNYEKKQKDCLENFSEPLECRDLVILLLLIFNIWIFFIGIMNFSCTFIIAAQFGLERTYEFFIGAKRKIVIQILEIILFFLMLLNYFSFNFTREMHLRILFNEIFLTISDINSILGKVILITLIYMCILYRKEKLISLSGTDKFISLYATKENSLCAYFLQLIKFYFISMISNTIAQFENIIIFKYAFQFIGLLVFALPFYNGIVFIENNQYLLCIPLTFIILIRISIASEGYFIIQITVILVFLYDIYKLHEMKKYIYSFFYIILFLFHSCLRNSEYEFLSALAAIAYVLSNRIENERNKAYFFLVLSLFIFFLIIDDLIPVCIQNGVWALNLLLPENFYTELRLLYNQNNDILEMNFVRNILKYLRQYIN